jgi:leader peptidase (prepilin peptidase) / N-methyltransferase
VAFPEEKHDHDAATDRRRVMNPFLITALTLAGLVAGRGQRAIIVGYSVPADEPAEPAALAVERTGLAGEHTGLSVERAPLAAERTGPPPLAVELTTGVLLGALAVKFHPGLVLAAACWLALCAVPLAFIDAAVRRLPDALTSAAFAGTAVLALMTGAATGNWHSPARAILGGVALSGFYLLLALISPSGMGLGDVKTAASLGSVLALSGWTALVVGGFAGFLLAAGYGVALLASGRATRKQQIPFGPFMIAGTFLIILVWPV